MKPSAEQQNSNTPSGFQLILKDVDSVLYVDTDILFLNPVDELWALLSRFDASQLAAMAPEHEEPRIGWYNRFARHPYYGATGVNSGVMLMNMTRIREKRFKVVIDLFVFRYSYNYIMFVCVCVFILFIMINRKGKLV
jgi:lipopolysaccharide biosynthesis glycosyltransferase